MAEDNQKGSKVTITSTLDNLAAAVTSNCSGDKKATPKKVSRDDDDILRAAAAADAAQEEKEDESEGDESESDGNEGEESPIEESIETIETGSAKPKCPKNEVTPMLLAMLKAHRCEEWVTRIRWKQLRNQREAVTIAACLDAMKKINLQAESVQILISRLQAVRLADYTKNWRVAQQLEKVPMPGAEIIPEAKLKAALKRSELYKKALQHKKEDSDEEDGETK